jgi:hypothetical protein
VSRKNKLIVFGAEGNLNEAELPPWEEPEI